MDYSQPFLQAALLCEGVTTDSEGHHDIHNEFSQYTMGYSQPFTILTIWRGGDGGGDGWYREKSEIVAPDGRVVASGENGPFTLADSSYRQVNSLLLEDVDFTHDGTYEVRVALTDAEDRVISSVAYPLTVV
jgi:hypothetical protein